MITKFKESESNLAWLSDIAVPSLSGGLLFVCFGWLIVLFVLWTCFVFPFSGTLRIEGNYSSWATGTGGGGRGGGPSPWELGMEIGEKLMQRAWSQTGECVIRIITSTLSWEWKANNSNNKGFMWWYLLETINKWDAASWTICSFYDYFKGSPTTWECIQHITIVEPGCDQRMGDWSKTLLIEEGMRLATQPKLVTSTPGSSALFHREG